jgi:hypothetical protein
MKLHCRHSSAYNQGNALVGERIVPSRTTELQYGINALRHREHCFLNFEQQISPRTRTSVVALEELGVGIDRRERVAHIVGYRACHPADCRHPLCLYQLDWCTPFVSQIQSNTLIKHENIAAV